MLARERQLFILSRLKSHPMISISDLCKEMNVSKSTVRRDLKLLEDQGRIVRERGGVVEAGLIETMSDLTEAPVLEKVNINSEEKKVIGQLAAAEVSDGDLIFIDSGTTPLDLIPYLYNKKIKIVTNSFILLSRLNGLEADVYVLGGKYSKEHEVSFGPATMEQLQDFRFDKAFIGASGADIALGEVYTSEFEYGSIKKSVMKRSKHSYLLIDDSKFRHTGLSAFGHFKDFDKIFTNATPGDTKTHKNIITP